MEATPALRAAGSEAISAYMLVVDCQQALTQCGELVAEADAKFQAAKQARKDVKRLIRSSTSWRRVITLGPKRAWAERKQAAHAYREARHDYGRSRVELWGLMAERQQALGRLLQATGQYAALTGEVERCQVALSRK